MVNQYKSSKITKNHDLFSGENLEKLRILHVKSVKTANQIFKTLGNILLAPLVCCSIHIIIEIIFVMKGQTLIGNAASATYLIRDIFYAGIIIYCGDVISKMVSSMVCLVGYY